MIPHSLWLNPIRRCCCCSCCCCSFGISLADDLCALFTRQEGRKKEQVLTKVARVSDRRPNRATCTHTYTHINTLLSPTGVLTVKAEGVRVSNKLDWFGLYRQTTISYTAQRAHTHTAAFLLIVATERRVCLCVCRWTSFNGFCHEVQVDW